MLKLVVEAAAYWVRSPLVVPAESKRSQLIALIPLMSAAPLFRLVSVMLGSVPGSNKFPLPSKVRSALVMLISVVGSATVPVGTVTPAVKDYVVFVKDGYTSYTSDKLT